MPPNELIRYLENNSKILDDKWAREGNLKSALNKDIFLKILKINLSLSFLKPNL